SPSAAAPEVVGVVRGVGKRPSGVGSAAGAAASFAFWITSEGRPYGFGAGSLGDVAELLLSCSLLTRWPAGRIPPVFTVLWFSPSRSGWGAAGFSDDCPPSGEAGRGAAVSSASCRSLRSSLPPVAGSLSLL